MLPKQHRLCTDKAKVQDLANLLKDGVLICNLLNHLVPETLDPRDFSQRPQMSQVGKRFLPFDRFYTRSIKTINSNSLNLKSN